MVVLAHIGGVPVEEWLPFVVPVVALYLYGRHRERRRKEQMGRLADPRAAHAPRTVQRVQASWMAAGHDKLAGEDVPILYPPGPDGMTAAELAERTGSPPAAVSAALERLEQLGYLELQHAGDREEATAWLTTEGYDAMLVTENALLRGAGAAAETAGEGP
ncbi:MAG TPA: MarR family transcriptional regulator [Solirubrobacteraceae bacterium]|jgi:DNA-binding transcriptional ArsR family regulator|nr:MarR family transcriptional regulator [Solirubrobacteraceae bacterium]